jgi:hypothetical protein
MHAVAATKFQTHDLAEDCVKLRQAHHYDRDMDCYKQDINFYCFSVKNFEFKIRLN